MTDNNLPDPDACEQILHSALTQGDIYGIEAALTVMTPQDPYRARRLIDALDLALTFARPAPEGLTP